LLKLNIPVVAINAGQRILAGTGDPHPALSSPPDLLPWKCQSVHVCLWHIRPVNRYYDTVSSCPCVGRAAWPLSRVRGVSAAPRPRIIY